MQHVRDGLMAAEVLVHKLSHYLHPNPKCVHKTEQHIIKPCTIPLKYTLMVRSDPYQRATDLSQSRYLHVAGVLWYFRRANCVDVTFYGRQLPVFTLCYIRDRVVEVCRYTDRCSATMISQKYHRQQAASPPPLTIPIPSLNSIIIFRIQKKNNGMIVVQIPARKSRLQEIKSHPRRGFLMLLISPVSFPSRGSGYTIHHHHPPPSLDPHMPFIQSGLPVSSYQEIETMLDLHTIKTNTSKSTNSFLLYNLD